MKTEIIITGSVVPYLSSLHPLYNKIVPIVENLNNDDWIYCDKISDSTIPTETVAEHDCTKYAKINCVCPDGYCGYQPSGTIKPETVTVKIDESFEEFMRNSRNDFVKVITDYFPHEQGAVLPPEARERYLKVRVACEDLLICFDQMRDKILNPHP